MGRALCRRGRPSLCRSGEIRAVGVAVGDRPIGDRDACSRGDEGGQAVTPCASDGAVAVVLLVEMRTPPC